MAGHRSVFLIALVGMIGACGGDPGPHQPPEDSAVSGATDLDARASVDTAQEEDVAEVQSDVDAPEDVTETLDASDDADTNAPGDADTNASDDADTMNTEDTLDDSQVEEDAVDDDAPGPDPLATCDELAPLPLRWSHYGGLGGAEDYCLDNQGNMWLVQGGTLKKQTPDGSIVSVTPNIGGTAGTGCLSDGRIVIAQDDTLIVAHPDGGYSTILAGLEYPNGLDIDVDDTIYVAEQNAGRLRAVNPDTGDFTVVATGLHAANGVSFGPGYHRVYVGSFGGGWVHGINRKMDGSWGDPWVLARIHKDHTPVIDEPLLNVPTESDYAPCDGAAAAAPCVTPDGWDGACVETDWGTLCERAPDASSPAVSGCLEKASGDACAISVLGEPMAGTCYPPEEGPACCRTADTPGCINPACESCVCNLDGYCCQGSWDESCRHHGLNSCAEACKCVLGGTLGGKGTEPLACYVHFDPTGPCEGLEVGAQCTIMRDWKSFFKGNCTDLTTDAFPAPYPEEGLGCVSDDFMGGGGGLDGLNVDACGNVYVTEYVLGYVWRIDPMGGIAKAVKLPNYWIPNMEFGRGVGGYHGESLFVIPINQGFLFELPAGVRGKESTVP